MTDPVWQGVRRLVEDSFVERDFFQLYVAQTQAINGVILDFIYKYCDAAWKDGALTVAMLTEFMTDWRAEEGKWSDHVVKTVAAESAENKALVSQWARHWIDRATEAVTPLSQALLGDDGASARAAGEAAQARARALGLSL
jgi:phenol hydroxylase P1 protein